MTRVAVKVHLNSVTFEIVFIIGLLIISIVITYGMLQSSKIPLINDAISNSKDGCSEFSMSY